VVASRPVITQKRPISSLLQYKKNLVKLWWTVDTHSYPLIFLKTSPFFNCWLIDICSHIWWLKLVIDLRWWLHSIHKNRSIFFFYVPSKHHYFCLRVPTNLLKRQVDSSSRCVAFIAIHLILHCLYLKC
jgi:hypothetical protein